MVSLAARKAKRTYDIKHGKTPAIRLAHKNPELVGIIAERLIKKIHKTKKEVAPEVEHLPTNAVELIQII